MKQKSGLILAFCLALALPISVSAQTAASQPGKASEDIIKMVQAGIGEDVILTYVQNAKTVFHLGADDIIALKEAKVSSAVIQAMLLHDAQVVGSAAGSSSSTAPVPQPNVSSNPDPNAAPAQLAEAIPMTPGPEYEWAHGYWYWNGAEWVWIYGAWRPRIYFGWHRRGIW